MSPPREVAALLNTREGQLVVRARLYRVLSAGHEEFMIAGWDSPADQIDATLPDLALVDALAIEDTEEIDLVCGLLVRRLLKGKKVADLELLRTLSPDRRAAVVLALPESRRRAIMGSDYEKKGTFAEIEPGQVSEVEAALLDNELEQREIDECCRTIGIDGERITRELRKYHQGLPYELTDEEVRPLTDEEGEDARRLLAELEEE